MKEFIEKLIGRLEEVAYNHFDLKLSDAKEIVNQLAEEYNNGWIPCSERLPDKSGWFLCTQEYHSLTNRKFIKVTTELVEFYDNKWRRANNLVVTHWQPLPAPYQPKGE